MNKREFIPYPLYFPGVGRERYGSADVKMYANDLILTNETGGERAYHIFKPETLNVPALA